MGEGTGLGGHPFERAAAGEQVGQGLQQELRGETGFKDHRRCTCQDKSFGVFALVVVGSLGKRDEQRRFACSSQFGHGAGSAPGQHQIGSFEAAGHVVEKGVNLPARRGSVAGLVGGEGGFGVTGSGLVQDGKTGYSSEQRRRDLRQKRVENACALAASKDEQVRRRGRGAGREAKEFVADGDSGELRIAEIFRSGGKVDCGGIYALAYEAVGEAWVGVGFEGKRGNAPKNSCAHGRAGGIASDSDDDVGAEITQQLTAADEAERQVEQRARFRHERDVFELAHFDERERISSLGHETRFETARGSDEEYLGAVSGFELAGNGKGGNDVPAGASSGDGDFQFVHLRQHIFPAGRPGRTIRTMSPFRKQTTVEIDIVGYIS